MRALLAALLSCLLCAACSLLPPATASLQPVARDECDADLAERSDRRTLRESAEHLPEGIVARMDGRSCGALLFWHIPKTGGSTFEHFMCKPRPAPPQAPFALLPA